MFHSDLSNDEMNAIRFCLNNLEQDKPKTYIELGIDYGATVKTVLTEYDDVYVIGVDLFEDFIDNPSTNTHNKGPGIHKEEIESNLKSLGFTNERFKLIKNDTLIAISELPETENCVVFIDANHKYWATLSDFLMLYHKLTNSYVVFHNSSIGGNIDRIYVATDGGPNRVVQEIKSSGKYNVEFIKQMDRSAIVRIYR